MVHVRQHFAFDRISSRCYTACYYCHKDREVIARAVLCLHIAELLYNIIQANVSSRSQASLERPANEATGQKAYLLLDDTVYIVNQTIFLEHVESVRRKGYRRNLGHIRHMSIHVCTCIRHLKHFMYCRHMRYCRYLPEMQTVMTAALTMCSTTVNMHARRSKVDLSSFLCAHAQLSHLVIATPAMAISLNVKEVPERLRFDLESLRRYLASELPGFECAQGTLRVRQFGHGQSNPTYHLATSSGQEYALRRRPPGKLLPGAHRVSQPVTAQTSLCRK